MAPPIDVKGLRNTTSSVGPPHLGGVRPSPLPRPFPGCHALTSRRLAPVLSKMEGALSAPLPVRLLLFVALPAAGWLTTNAPRPLSTVPQVGPGGRSRPLLCRDLREAGRGDADLSRRWTAGGAGLDRVWRPAEKGGRFPGCRAVWVPPLPEGERKEGAQASLNACQDCAYRT